MSLNDAFSPTRPEPCQSSWPVLTSSANSEPRCRVAMPYNVVPLTTGVLMYKTKVLFSQTISGPAAVTLTANVGLYTPPKMMSSPATTGVTLFCSKVVLNGSRHSSRPSSGETATQCFCIWVTICRTPPRVATTGDAYAGPSPVHFQRT